MPDRFDVEFEDVEYQLCCSLTAAPILPLLGAGWTPSKLVAWSASVGPPVAELIATILTTRPHPEHGHRACMGLKRLVKQDGGERVSAARQRALEIQLQNHGVPSTRRARLP